MKKVLLLLLILQVQSAFSQEAHFTYDAAGNRIRREFISYYRNQPSRRQAGSRNSNNLLTDKLVRIYPNPTDGLLKIEMMEYDSSTPYVIKLLTSSGQQMISRTCSSATTQIDISQRPTGIYFLQIMTSDGAKKTWKIVKK